MNRLFLLVCLAVCSFFSAGGLVRAAEKADADSTRLRPAIDFWQTDSLSARHEPYRSFADIANRLPGIYVAHRGSAGQPSRVSLFGGAPGRVLLRYDGLDLSDPLSGLSDFNLIPTESVAHTQLVFDAAARLSGWQVPGGGLDLRTIDMAAVPVRTRIVYRTGGAGYDDIDLRLGARVTPQTRLNTGVLMKNSDGTDLQHPYEAKKINLRLEHRFGQQTTFRYCLLRNTSDVDLLLPIASVAAPKLAIALPHLKQVRTDHGFSLNLPHQVSHHLQITDLYREFYSLQDRGERETVDALRAIWSSHWQGCWGAFEPMAGAQFQFARLKSQAWGDHDEQLHRAWAGIGWRPASRLRLMASGTAVQTRQDVQLNPEVTAEYLFSPASRVHAWMRRQSDAPGLEQRFRYSLFANGDADLSWEHQTSVGVAVQRGSRSLDLAFSAAWLNRQDPVLLKWNAVQQSALYGNGPQQETLCFDLAGEWRFWRDFTLNGRGQFLQALDDEKTELIGRPEWFARMQLVFHHIWFQGDLDLRLFSGIDYWGKQTGMLPLDSQLGGWPVSLSAAAVPWLQVTADIRSALIFAQLGNALDLEVQSLAGFPQPGRFLRWGLVWSFYD